MVQKLLESGKDGEAVYLLTDLVVCFIANLRDDNIAFLWRILQAQLKEKDERLHKKTYKAMEHICLRHADWVVNNRSLMSNLITSSSSTKKVSAATTCIRYISCQNPFTGSDALLGSRN